MTDNHSKNHLLWRFIRHASANFPTATTAERDRLCMDLERLVETEGTDLDTALAGEHGDLLIQVRRHQHHQASRDG